MHLREVNRQLRKHFMFYAIECLEYGMLTHVNYARRFVPQTPILFPMLHGCSGCFLHCTLGVNFYQFCVTQPISY